VADLVTISLLSLCFMGFKIFLQIWLPDLKSINKIWLARFKKRLIDISVFKFDEL